MRVVRDREDEADERAVAFGEPQVLGPHQFHNLQVECEERRLGNCGIKEIISKARECEGMNALQVILDAGRVEGVSWKWMMQMNRRKGVCRCRV